MGETAAEREARYRADGVARLLAQIEAGDEGQWFEGLHFAELAGRTMTEAYRAGDRDGVLRVIDAMYERTERTIEQHRADPEWTAMIERRRAELATERAKRSA